MNRKKPHLRQEAGLGDKINSGGVLLSHAVARVAPLALPGLTSEFGMGSGVAPALWPPETFKDGFRFSVFGFR